LTAIGVSGLWQTVAINKFYFITYTYCEYWILKAVPQNAPKRDSDLEKKFWEDAFAMKRGKPSLHFVVHQSSGLR